MNEERVQFDKITETKTYMVGVLRFDKEHTEILLPTDPILLEEIADLFHNLADQRARR